jgi:Tn3 transposase DDE domain
MIKYATAIRTRTASTEAILRRFMQANAIHPTYQAMIEFGRAQKTLYGDTLGPKGSRGATYLSMELANADAMVRGFTGNARHCTIPGP